MLLDIKSSHKQLSTQIANTDLDVVDVRRVVREHFLELNAKINSLDEQVATTRNDLLEFNAQVQQTLNIIIDQLSELVAYINRGGNDKKGEVGSSRGPQPPPEDQNRGSGNTGGGGDTVRTTDIPQRDIDNAQRNILERLMSADRARERERRSPHQTTVTKRNKERRRTIADKRPTRKNDRKALVVEESNKNWADSDSDSTSSSSSSNDSDQEETHCLMDNQSTEEEVFDFSNTEFTREDLINALNEMVHEYRNLSQKFDEAKAENNGLKNSSIESSPAQLEDTDSLQTKLSKLKSENESLRLRSCDLESENERLNLVMSSWTQSSVSLSKLHEIQKPLNDKSGLGFNVGESSSGETCTQSNLVYDKFKKMNFVKASVIHNTYESVKYDDQTSGQLNQKGKAGIGYIRPENSKPNWLKNRLQR
ncbi:hypothetical protein F511_26161 [Dorcoceras hygrometricum]|uniref:Uncharacterized protein n=1 Tax=Dorcoceras hygrometricum TaxID=472368 RepID=A0A2Z7AAS7_9LAMI|nr:hypothetical protein F511_26161 [Dorcoceras hygrometricum]